LCRDLCRKGASYHRNSHEFSIFLSFRFCVCDFVFIHLDFLDNPLLNTFLYKAGGSVFRDTKEVCNISPVEAIVVSIALKQ